MWLKYSYKKLPVNNKRINDKKFFGSSSLKPIIPVIISSYKKSIRCELLVDSGADFNIINGDIGDYLGLQVKKGMLIEFGGIQGGSAKIAKAYIHEVKIEVGGNEFTTKIGFTYDIDKRAGYGVLGQKGFFDLFIVKFDFQAERIELLPKN